MKLALPIGLVAFGVVMVAILMTPHHWNVRTYADWQADKDKVEQAKQKLFDQNPKLKAEDSDLTSKYEQADKTARDAKKSNYEARSALINLDGKIRDELVNNDPSLGAVFDRLELDKRIPFLEGDQRLFAEYNQPPGWYRYLFLLVSYALPAVTLGVGIILLFRLPSWAGAHLFLIFVILPLVLLGPFMLRFAIGVYLMRFGEFDMAPTPYLFQQAYQMLFLVYLAYLPSLLIYVALLFRIHLRERKEKTSSAQE